MDDNIIQLKFAHFFPIESFTGQCHEYYARTLEEESNGQIKVEVFPAGTLIAQEDALDAIQWGTVDITQFQVAYTAPTIKELTLFEIPGVYPGTKFKEFARVIEPIANKIFDKYDIKYLTVLAQENLVFVGNRIVKSPNDLKGLKIRAAGKWGAEAIQAWGGSPVTIPIGDVPTAMQLGTVDLVHTSWIATRAFKLFETGPNVTFTNQQEVFVGLMMSGAAWEKLNNEQREAVYRTNQRYIDYTYELLLKDKEGLLKDLKDAGTNVYYLTDEENKLFNEAVTPVIEKAKEVSGPLSEEILAVFDSLK